MGSRSRGSPEAPLVYIFVSCCYGRVNTRLLFHPRVKCRAANVLRFSVGLWFLPASRSQVHQDKALWAVSGEGSSRLPGFCSFLYCSIFTSEVNSEPRYEVRQTVKENLTHVSKTVRR